MTDPQGGSPPSQGFVFPPFAPPVFRQGTPPAEAPPPLPPVEPTAGYELEVPVPAHDVFPPEGVDDDEEPEAPTALAAPRGGVGAKPGEAAGEPHAEGPAAASADAGAGEGGDEELPWLELPAPPRVHAVDEPAATAVEEVQPPPLPDWMSWNPPAPAAEEPVAEDENVVRAGDIVVVEEPAAEDEAGGDDAAWDADIPELPAREPAAAWDDAVAESQEPAMWDGALPEAPGGELAEEAPAGYFASAVDAPSGDEAEEDAFPTSVNSQITDEVSEDAFPSTVNPQITDAVAEDAYPTAVNPQITDDVTESLAPAVVIPEPTDEAAEDAFPTAVNSQVTDAVASGGRLDDVADRLEAAARALREDPDAFLRGRAGDPLHLLLAGFVLGYRQGRETGNG